MNFKNILKSRNIFLLLTKNTSRSPRFLPFEIEPGVYPYLRRQVPLDGLKSLKERLEEIEKAKSSHKLELVNIGYAIPKESKRHDKKKERNPNLEALARKRNIFIDCHEIHDKSRNQMPSIMKNLNIARFFNIYEDLFHSPHFFYPIKEIELNFHVNEENKLPVYYGNLISPSNCRTEPDINFESDDESLWTVVLTCPDEHLEENDKEYVHWIVSNISMKDGNITNKECVVPYLQPIPFLGTGFHRYVFVLYKQDKGKVDLSAHFLPNNCILEDRTFSSYEFLQKNQEILTPVGISFFQAAWDFSVRQCFRDNLNCLEPIFEYNWPKDRLKPMETFPENKEMHTYYDQYRDVKDLQQEVLIERLKTVDPFVAHKRLEFPLAVPDDPTEIGFVKDKFKQRELRRDHWKDMDIVDEIL